MCFDMIMDKKNVKLNCVRSRRTTKCVSAAGLRMRSNDQEASSTTKAQLRRRGLRATVRKPLCSSKATVRKQQKRLQVMCLVEVVDGGQKATEIGHENVAFTHQQQWGFTHGPPRVPSAMAPANTTQYLMADVDEDQFDFQSGSTSSAVFPAKRRSGRSVAVPTRRRCSSCSQPRRIKRTAPLTLAATLCTPVTVLSEPFSRFLSKQGPLPRGLAVAVQVQKAERAMSIMSSTGRRQSLVSVYKIKKKVNTYSSFFKASLKMRNKALAEEVTLLKENNRGLQMQSVALLKENQAHKFALATSRHNERRLLDTLNALKTHVDMAAVMSSDLKTHVDMMIDQVSPDDDTPEKSPGCSRQPVNDTGGEYDIQVESGKRPVQFPPRPDIPTNGLPQTRTENASTKSSDFPGGSNYATDLGCQAGRRKLLRSSSVRVTDRRKSQVLPQPALVAIRCEESPSLVSAPVINPPSSSMAVAAADQEDNTSLLNAELELTTSDATELFAVENAVNKKKRGTVKSMAVAAADQEDNTSLLNAELELTTSDATELFAAENAVNKKKRGTVKSMAVAAADQEDNTMLLNAELELTTSDATELFAVESAVSKKKRGTVKIKENIQVGEEAVLLMSGKENETLTDHRGAGGDCEAENSEARSPEMQCKPISTLLQICNRTEEVQPSALPRCVASRIPKLKKHPACDLNPDKESSKSEIPEDFQRFNTRQPHLDDDDNAQEHEPCPGQQLDETVLVSADTSATFPSSEPSRSLSLTLPSSEPSHSLSLSANKPHGTRKRVKETTPAGRQGNLIGPLRAKRGKKESTGEFKSHDDRRHLQDSADTDLDFEVLIPARASPDPIRRRNRPRCRETFVVLEKMLTPQTSTNTATDDGGVTERPTGEVHVPSRRNHRPRCRETFVVPENNNESSASEMVYEDPIVPAEASPVGEPSLTNTTATDNGVGHSRRPRCRETFVVLERVMPQTSTNTATDNGGVQERPTGEVHIPSRRNARPRRRETFVVNECPASVEDPVVISPEASPEGCKETFAVPENMSESSASETVYEDPVVVPAEASPEIIFSTATDDGGTVGHSKRNDSPRCRERSVVLERLSTSQTSTNMATDVHIRERPTGEEVHIPSSRDGPRCRETSAVNECSARDEDAVVISPEASPERCTFVVPEKNCESSASEQPVIPHEASPGRLLTASVEDNVASDEGTSRPRRRRHAAVNYKEPPINCKMRRGESGDKRADSPTKNRGNKKKPKKSSHP